MPKGSKCTSVWGQFLSILAVVSLLVMGPRMGIADTTRIDRRVLQLFQQSEAHYQRGEFRQAVDLLTEAYRLHPEPTILYNLGRANEGLGDLKAAVTAYERYLAEDKDIADRGAIEQRVATLREQIAVYERLTTEHQRERQARVDVEEQLAQTRPVRVWAWVITGIGAATLAAGGVLGLLATGRHRSAVNSGSQRDALSLHQEAESLATNANVAFALGAAVTLGGTIWLLLPDGERTTNEARVQFWLSPSAAGAVYRF